MPILETQRLILRDFCLDDLDAIYELVYADPVVKDTWSGVQGTPEEIKQRFAETYIRPGGPYGLKAIVLKGKHTLIGLMGFQVHDKADGEEIAYLRTKENPRRRLRFNREYPEVELTYALGRAYWKQGYATEMGRAMVDYGFTTLRVGQIIQGVLARNLNSVNLMRRLGFHIEQGIDPQGVVGVLERPEYSDQ